MGGGAWLLEWVSIVGTGPSVAFKMPRGPHAIAGGPKGISKNPGKRILPEPVHILGTFLEPLWRFCKFRVLGERSSHSNIFSFLFPEYTF